MPMKASFLDHTCLCKQVGKDRDPHLAETLTREYEGNLQWIIKGAKAYENGGLKPPSR